MSTTTITAMSPKPERTLTMALQINEELRSLLPPLTPAELPAPVPDVLLPVGCNGAATPAPMAAMTVAIAEHYYGRYGPLGYRLFEAVNAALFAGALPWPLVLWEL